MRRRSRSATSAIVATRAEHRDNELVYVNAHKAAGDYLCHSCGNQHGPKRFPTRAALRAHFKERHIRDVNTNPRATGDH